MVKRLDRITTSPYGIFASESAVKGPQGDQFVIKLCKLDKIECKEGDRFSENGLICTTSVTKSWCRATQALLNEVVEKIIEEHQGALRKINR